MRQNNFTDVLAWCTAVLWVVLMVFVNDVVADHKIKIGVILPLTGDASAWGVDIKNSILYANDNIPKEKFEIIFEDDRCVGKNAVAAAHKLIEMDNVNYAMVACSEPMISTAKLFENHRVPVIAPVASASAVSGLGEYIFRTWPSDALAAKVLFEYVKGRYKRIGVISELKGYSQELHKSFSSCNARQEIEIFNEDFSDFTTEGKSILLKMKKNNVDAIFLNPNGPDVLSLMVKQTKELHFNTALFGVLIPGEKKFIRQGDGDGMIFVDGPSLSLLGEYGKSNYENFVSQFGEPQSNPFVFASTFEAVRLFDIGRNQKLPLISFLKDSQHHGIFGDYTFDINGDIQGVSHVLKIIRGSDAQEIK